MDFFLGTFSNFLKVILTFSGDCNCTTETITAAFPDTFRGSFTYWSALVS